MEKAKLAEEISEGESKVDALGAQISQATEEASALGDEIAKLNEDVASAEGDKKAEEEKRAGTHAAYLVEVADYSESVDALERAIAVMESKNRDIPATAAGAASLLQLPEIVKMTPESR